MKEWMPVNPCDDCSHIVDRGCPNDDGCRTYKTHISNTAAQRKLLEYLIAHVADPSRQFESMLKELEAK
jgi:hypothetical protein